MAERKVAVSWLETQELSNHPTVAESVVEG